MQTPYAEHHRPSPGVRRWLSAAAAAALTVTASACTMPRIQGRAEAEREPSACEQALYTAMDADETAASALPMLMRYPATRTARDSWLDVAVSCPSRFAEGVMRAARASAWTDAIATTFSLEGDDAGWDDAGVTSLDADRHRSSLNGLVDLSAAADAEDRTGFAFEVLAARHAPGASLGQSDRCKAAAQMFASLSDSDSRRGVYDTTDLLAHPDRMEDAATGLSAPTSAVLLMDCARALADAVRDGEDADSPSDDGAQPDPALVDEAWRAYAVQAADHAAQAFRLGYPMFDEALFADPASGDR